MSKEKHPVLWASTYNAADHLPPPPPDSPDTSEAKTSRIIAGCDRTPSIKTGFTFQ